MALDENQILELEQKFRKQARNQEAAAWLKEYDEYQKQQGSREFHTYQMRPNCKKEILTMHGSDKFFKDREKEWKTNLPTIHL